MSRGISCSCFSLDRNLRCNFLFDKWLRDKSLRISFRRKKKPRLWSGVHLFGMRTGFRYRDIHFLQRRKYIGRTLLNFTNRALNSTVLFIIVIGRSQIFILDFLWLLRLFFLFIFSLSFVSFINPFQCYIADLLCSGIHIKLVQFSFFVSLHQFPSLILLLFFEKLFQLLFI